ncbi:bleomycin resistance protein [Streptomyces sp. CS090A]|uniref:VOC family protein n=1 Tax=Streptomyces sp. CS090A TaxID=2162710 RepID=UPI000D511369|nr:VOC family protein [Streptomyces sp. CS090A]PVD01614.1 bleomycin resistance protein [Streptomyces sp. CS090A]
MTMPTTTVAPPVRGAPCWVNLLVRDLSAAQAFYSAVLGWTFDSSGMLGEGFSIALADGRPVAGIGARSPFLAAPTVWMPYFASADVNASADRIRERGATVAVGPLAVGEGRAAIASDRDGAVFGIWEGAAPVWSPGTAGAMPWLELWTRDAFEAALFYGEVFSWPRPGPDAIDVAYEEEQVVARVAGHPMAVLSGGAVGSAPDPRIRPRWIVHFPVDDAARAAAQADRAGGETFPAPGVRSSEYVVQDPEGALFTVAEEPGGVAGETGA